MKQLLIALNVVLLVLVSILFYLHFDDKNKPAKAVAPSAISVAPSSIRIAYFEMDSVQANYEYFKDALNQLKKKESAMNAELAGMERSYQQKVSAWQQKGPTMSQTEAAAVQRENAQLQQNFQQRKQTLEEGYTRESLDFKNNIKQKIAEYLQEYNKDRKYSYILSYEPEFIYYRDTTMNITRDLLSGLNETYKKK